MGVFGYLLKRASLLDAERFNKHIDTIKKNTGKSKLYIKMDFLKNFLIYGCGYTDYFRGDYINLSRKEKKTFVTAKSFYKILKYFNNEDYKKYLSDKVLFNRFFKDFIGRDFIDLREATLDDFLKFISDKSVIFAKVIDGFGGHGISRIDLAEYEDKEGLYNWLIENKQYLVEEAIEQLEEIKKINPNSVSSFRVVTLYKNGKAYVIGNALRVNHDEADVIGCTNDLYFSFNKDGKIDSNVIDDYANVYEKHPLTHVSFSDICVPDVKEAFEMCKRAAIMLPEVRYIGWDVAFSKKGPVFLEGNEYPGYGIIQFYKLKNSRTGHYKTIKEVCPDEKIL